MISEFAKQRKYCTLEVEMLYSKSFIKTYRETPKEADAISSSLLMRGSYIDKVAAGVYTLLPLGWQVASKIMKIIREEMNAINGQELYMPSLLPKELWEETGRFKTIDPPLFIVKDRHEKEYGLASTHEEVVTNLAKKFISSYKDLPKMIYQIQNKFRNEMRSTGGLLRVREFLMKDAYSFHATNEDFEDYYKKVIEAYKKIFSNVGVDVRLVEAHSGSIGGEKSNEFMLLSETGEDTIFICEKCDWAANTELIKNVDKCPKCGGKVSQTKAIEVAHIFSLGTLYSKKMGANYTDADGKLQPLIMGCYGIGIGRLMAAIIEANHDEAGIIWPKEIAPYDIYLIDLEGSRGEKVYEELIKAGIGVLFDDRDVSAGVKFSDADLLGLPYRLTVSNKTLETDSIELKKRSEKETKLIKISEITEVLK